MTPESFSSAENAAIASAIDQLLTQQPEPNVAEQSGAGPSRHRPNDATLNRLLEDEASALKVLAAPEGIGNLSSGSRSGSEESWIVRLDALNAAVDQMGEVAESVRAAALRSAMESEGKTRVFTSSPLPGKILSADALKQQLLTDVMEALELAGDEERKMPVLASPAPMVATVVSEFPNATLNTSAGQILTAAGGLERLEGWVVHPDGPVTLRSVENSEAVDLSAVGISETPGRIGSGVLFPQGSKPAAAAERLGAEVQGSVDPETRCVGQSVELPQLTRNFVETTENETVQGTVMWCQDGPPRWRPVRGAAVSFLAIGLRNDGDTEAEENIQSVASMGSEIDTRDWMSPDDEDSDDDPDFSNDDIEGLNPTQTRQDLTAEVLAKARKTIDQFYSRHWNSGTAQAKAVIATELFRYYYGGLCVRNFSRPCPIGWIQGAAAGVCDPPADYKGFCGPLDLSRYVNRNSAATRQKLAAMVIQCGLDWPCKMGLPAVMDNPIFCPEGWMQVYSEIPLYNLCLAPDTRRRCSPWLNTASFTPTERARWAGRCEEKWPPDAIAAAAELQDRQIIEDTETIVLPPIVITAPTQVVTLPRGPVDRLTGMIRDPCELGSPRAASQQCGVPPAREIVRAFLRKYTYTSSTTPGPAAV